MGRCPGCAHCNHKGPYKREARGSKIEKGDVTREAEVGVIHFEERGRGH